MNRLACFVFEMPSTLFCTTFLHHGAPESAFYALETIDSPYRSRWNVRESAQLFIEP